MNLTIRFLMSSAVEALALSFFLAAFALIAGIVCGVI